MGSVWRTWLAELERAPSRRGVDTEERRHVRMVIAVDVTFVIAKYLSALY